MANHGLLVKALGLGGAASAAGLVGLAAASCRDATELTVVVEAQGVACSALQGVAIVVGPDPKTVEERAAGGIFTAVVPAPAACDGDRVGTLVVVPGTSGGEQGAIAVIAGVNADATTCRPPDYAGCVIARRAFTFVDHASLSVPIAVDASCVGVPCDADSTCVDRGCVSSTIGCDANGCAPPGGPPVVPDAGPSDDGDGAAPADGGDGGGVNGDAGDGGDGGPLSGDGGGTCDPSCSTASSTATCGATTECCTTAANGLVCQTDGDCVARFCCIGRADCGGNLCCQTSAAGKIVAVCAAPGQAACPATSTGVCRTASDCPIPMSCEPRSGGYGECVP